MSLSSLIVRGSTPVTAYRSLIDKGAIRHDDSQERAVAQLNRVYEDLMAQVWCCMT